MANPDLVAKFLSLQFQGYFMCRLATDPDPTDEPLGVSGYTMALVNEEPLDQVIRLQAPPEYLKTNLRELASAMGIKVGVDIYQVLFDGLPYEPDQCLVGAKVYLIGQDDIFSGPTFESRNNITGSDNTMAFVVTPFHLQIRHDDRPWVEALDEVNLAQPQQPIWQVADPNLYTRRLPRSFEAQSKEVMEATGVFDFYGYFRARRRFLNQRIAQEEKTLSGIDSDSQRQDAITRIQQFRSRLYQLELWGDRVISKLGYQLIHEHHINGKQWVDDQVHERLRGRIAVDQPWLIQYWFGGWDGDLLMGYMRGTLNMPFRLD